MLWRTVSRDVLRAQDVDDLERGGETLVVSVGEHQFFLVSISTPEAVVGFDTSF